MAEKLDMVFAQDKLAQLACMLTCTKFLNNLMRYGIFVIQLDEFTEIINTKQTTLNKNFIAVKTLFFINYFFMFQ